MATIDDGRREDILFRILTVFEMAPHVSQRELAHSVGISLGGAHQYLRHMAQRGLLKRKPLNTVDGQHSYIMTSQGEAFRQQLAPSFLARRLKESAIIKAEIALARSLCDAVGI
jgi:predicted transcriptional regulator